jgi:hypothetical protein
MMALPLEGLGTNYEDQVEVTTPNELVPTPSSPNGWAEVKE